MHGGELARQFGSRRLLIPRHPGILCALGLLATDLRYDLARTRIQRAPNYDLADMAATFDALEREADATLDAEGVVLDRRRLSRAADLRYAKQGVEITVEVAEKEVTAGSVARLIEAFHDLHERLYTFADRDAPVEIVNLRIAATGVMDKVDLPAIDTVPEGTPAEPHANRRVHLGGAFATVPVHRREDLRAGHVIAGPAIVDQLDTTTVLLPGQTALTDAYGSLIVTDTEV